ncbi:MAG: tryptophan--tRNA ligase [Promethearchaeota archaeon]
MEDQNEKERKSEHSLDPWGMSIVGEDEYERLLNEFGIERVELANFPLLKKNRFFRRNVIFGHRGLELVEHAMIERKPWAVMSGIKPSGSFHLGTFTTASEIVEFQKMGAKAYYCIADIESWEDNGIPYDKAFEYAVDNLADILAVGLDPSPDRCRVWLQSRERVVKDVPFKIARFVTNNMLKAIYGERPIGLYLSAFVQVGDILLPQIKDEPQPTVVPVGIDQDPHIRLTRDLTKRAYKGFFLPGATYHKLLKGLDGSDKMSKRNPKSYFEFSEPEESIRKKLMGAFTGGRNNAKEQKELGGRPEVCMIYLLMLYHFEQDDAKVKEMQRRCRAGEILCGHCKQEQVPKILEYVREHQLKKEKLVDRARAMLESTD